jgi:hypothetical protein
MRRAGVCCVLLAQLEACAVRARVSQAQQPCYTVCAHSLVTLRATGRQAAVKLAPPSPEV